MIDEESHHQDDPMSDHLRAEARREWPTSFDAALHAQVMARVASRDSQLLPSPQRWPRLTMVIGGLATAAALAIWLAGLPQTTQPTRRPPVAIRSMPTVAWPDVDLSSSSVVDKSMLDPGRDVSHFLIEQWSLVSSLAPPASPSSPSPRT